MGLITLKFFSGIFFIVGKCMTATGFHFRSPYSKNIHAKKISPPVSSGRVFFQLPFPHNNNKGERNIQAYDDSFIFYSKVTVRKFSNQNDQDPLEDIGIQLSRLGKQLVDDDKEVDQELLENVWFFLQYSRVARMGALNNEFIDTFYSEVFKNDIFIPTSKPRIVPGGCIVAGTPSRIINNKITCIDIDKIDLVSDMNYGDILVDALDKQLSSTSLDGKIRFYYITDTKFTDFEGGVEEEVVEEEVPVLLVTNYDISPASTESETTEGIRSLLTIVVLFFLLQLESLSSFQSELPLNAEGIRQASNCLTTIALPVFSSLLASSIFHQLSSMAVAKKQGLQLGLPIVRLRLPLGFFETTPLLSPPKNMKSLFDFSVIGPISGVSFSILLMYVGLQKMLFLTTSELQQLPLVSADLFRMSSFGGGAIKYFLASNFFDTTGPHQLIRMHPLALAGFEGLILNALSLLPIGNTNGGRMCLAVLGRSNTLIIQQLVIAALFLLGLSGVYQAKIYLLFAIYCMSGQNELEVPCRNEVDGIDAGRFLVYICLIYAALLIIIPQSSG